jgi:ProQ/FINO family
MPPKTRMIVAPPVVTVRKKPKKQDPGPIARKPDNTPAPPVQQPKAAPPRPSTTIPVPQSPPQAEAVPDLISQPKPSLPAPEQETPPAVESASSPAPLSRRHREIQARKDLLAVFRNRWPVAFPRDFRHLKPLALRIHEDLAAALPDTPPALIKQTIALFQRWSGAGYWLAISKGGPRYDLEGNVRGAITPEEQARARQELTALYERKKAKRQATGVPEGAQPTGTLAGTPPQ